MAAEDYRVTALVRRLLTSRWIDVSRLQIGTTNGVVYLMGTFESSVEDPLSRIGVLKPPNDPTARIISLVTIVEKELRRTPGVRDVVYRLANLRKKRGKWQVLAAQGAAPQAQGGVPNDRFRGFGSHRSREEVRDADEEAK